jgi:FkbM family methyltransferase
MLIKLKGLLPIKFKTYLKKFKKFNAYHNLDKKLLKYIDYKNGFYIDCGANDGVNQSTTWYFEKYLSWRGILIEPVPEVYNELKNNRSNNNFFCNYALTSKKYKQQEMNFIYNNKDSLRAKNAQDTNSLKKNEKLITVKFKILEDILNNIKIPQLIDLFSLDVEGYEFEVLEGINFNTIKFKYILVETEFPQKMNNFLTQFGYSFIERLSNYNSLEKPEYGDYLYKNSLTTMSDVCNDVSTRNFKK